MGDYPPVDLAYLRSLTDCTGIIQHGVHSVPNKKLGYTTDDNARALVVAAQQYGRTKNREDLDLAVTYLSFLHYAQSPDHTFQNIMTYRRDFLDDSGTEDCFGRAIWGCGYAASSAMPENVRVVASKVFDSAIVWAGDLSSPRARAYTMIGMCYYLRANQHDTTLKDKVHALADSLMGLLHCCSDGAWHWYENYLTYGNAILPTAMLLAAEVTGDQRHLNAARSTIDFLTGLLFPEGYLDIIGNDGWYIKDRKRAVWDQQTIDAGYTVCLYAHACRVLGDRSYLDLARTAHGWFFGRNRREVWAYDPESRGCFDAITEWGVNMNQGAESCIAFLLAQMAVEGLSATE